MLSSITTSNCCYQIETANRSTGQCGQCDPSKWSEVNRSSWQVEAVEALRSIELARVGYFETTKSIEVSRLSWLVELAPLLLARRAARCGEVGQTSFSLLDW